MTDREARDIIENDIREKLLGPGYAKDIIVCSDDCYDEIIPESPRNAYRIGVIVPDTNLDDEDLGNEELTIMADEEDIDDIADDIADAKKLSESIGNPDDNDNSSNQINPMSKHIGLITCVSSENDAVDIEISYGTYEALSWEEQIRRVRVKTGKFTNSIPLAIAAFDNDNRVQESLGRPLRECIVINEEEETISLNNDLANIDRPTISLPDNPQYFVEGDLIKVLFSNCYSRTHHVHTLNRVRCDRRNEIGFYNDGNVRLYIDSYEVNHKRFLSVILRSITTQHYLYQPIIEVRGNLVSYTEPVTSIDDDGENAINEFLYRNVKNYGKGVNCAVNWDDDASRIYTTFTPTVDVEKFSNKPNFENREDPIENACILRNLSIWSEINIVQALNEFVNGYERWHQTQSDEARRINGFEEEKHTILNNQEVLLTRLRENINYLDNNAEALQCFKIANTAMLVQMVVARHPLFKKNRDAIYTNEPDNVYDDLDFFINSRYIDEFEGRRFDEPSFYPFQLAFLLMNVRSVFDVNDPDRRLVDLIWFPTGGGKTEAYLALSALTIVARRRRGQDSGVSVIMRYTLRLLTTQQFERASYLICALDFLRTTDQNLNLGQQPISIGLYVGSGVTPNNTQALGDGDYQRFFYNNNITQRRNNNPFPITYCPWCGSRLVNDEGRHGYANNGAISCINGRCHYRNNNGGLPLNYIDENIYTRRPTLLFATVDKFAQLYSGNHANLLRPDNVDTPDLIIQDELHLLVGALGSIVGLYESIIEKLCSNEVRFPKIIAATATTRNTSDLVRNLYNRECAVFPPQGIEYDDNYFSHVERTDSKRRHLGLIPAENVSSNMTEIRLTSLLILSKVKVFKKHIEELGLDWLNPENVISACNDDNVLAKVLDNYWSVVLYFNSLKDLGRSRSRVSQEILDGVRYHQYLYTIPNSLAFLRHNGGFNRRVLEFTSRIDSSQIKLMLTQAETPVHLNINNENISIHDANDLAFASNMISVGIDIARWNLMLMVGQPRSISEYIQSSSRAARSTYGLVVNLMNHQRIREKSLFENYVPFHKIFYKGVEPLSITPLTSATIKHKVLVNIVAIYMNYFIPANERGERETVAQTIIRDLFAQRYQMERGPLLTALMDEIVSIVDRINAQQPDRNEAAQSLREIASDSYISISGINYPRR